MSRDHAPVEVDGKLYAYGEFVKSPFVIRVWRFGITSYAGTERTGQGVTTHTLEGWRCLFWKLWWRLGRNGA